MNEPLPIENARKKSRETPICIVIASINNYIERASSNQKWEVEIDLTDKVKGPTGNYVTFNSYRGEQAASFLPNDYREALAIFRREGYGVQYFYDEHFNNDPYTGGYQYHTYKVRISWNEANK